MEGWLEIGRAVTHLIRGPGGGEKEIVYIQMNCVYVLNVSFCCCHNAQEREEVGDFEV